jgi:hypothetical protein
MAGFDEGDEFLYCNSACQKCSKLRIAAYLFSAFAISGATLLAQQQPQAQPQPPTQQAPQPLPTPAMTGPLQTAAPPITFDAGPLGKLDVGGIVSGIGIWQGNPVAGDKGAQGDLSNGQIFLQKTEGWWQFYLQAGAYNVPVLGTSFLSTGSTVSDFWGPVPVAYLKLAPTKNLSIEIGQLPTLIGAEYTFTFENMNVERGLLWGQENAIVRGIQVNDTFGKLTASVSWNDGFYSDRYTWMTGLLSYAFNASNTLAFDAGGNFDRTAFRSLATPVQNDGSIYNLIYTYTKGNWIVTPYFQYTSVPTNRKAGITQGADTVGGALLLTYNFPHHFSLSGRGEYLSSNGNAREQAVNLLYGPGSGAWSLTITPTFQEHGFFIRGDIAVPRATSYTPGDGFVSLGIQQTQPRSVIEAGFVF